MHVDRLDFNGNINIGLNGYCNNEYCLVGKDISENNIEILEKVLKVPVHQISIAGTSLIGVFLVGNKNKLLVPNIVFDSELKALDELKINYEVIDTKYTALGNNVLCNDEGAIVNSEMEEKAIKQIEKALKVNIITGEIAGLEIVGALCSHNSNKGLIHRDALDKEIELVEKTLKLELDIGTLNFGSPYINSAILVNDNGFVCGTATTGPEMQNADYAFGFLKK
ncbi:translation initiation factor IF-6 [Candidatus Woesearchaeota archaeon]|nr:MAG: translation initiation factor IF-6 [Candidatus Woesearchaeota archaeon]